MMNYGLRKFLLDNGFKENTPWQTFEHECGLEVICDEHEWSVDNDEKGWTEIGSLNDTSLIYELVEKYCSR